MELALTMAAECQVTALYVTHHAKDRARATERQEWLAEIIHPWRDRPNLNTQIVQCNDVGKGILATAQNFDIIVLGASNQTVFNQLMFGAFPQKIAAEFPGTTIIAKQVESRVDSFLRHIWWKVTHVIPQLTLEERVEVYKQVRRGARPKIDFFMMIGLAAGIAALGLLLDSRPVEIPIWL